MGLNLDYIYIYILTLIIKKTLKHVLNILSDTIENEGQREIEISDPKWREEVSFLLS